MKEGISELNETFNTMRRDITDKIFDIQRQLNGQLRTEMKVTSENYKRPLIDCGDLLFNMTWKYYSIMDLLL
jgi:hypothetical protein